MDGSGAKHDVHKAFRLQDNYKH